MAVHFKARADGESSKPMKYNLADRGSSSREHEYGILSPKRLRRNSFLPLRFYPENRTLKSLTSNDFGVEYISA